MKKESIIFGLITIVFLGLITYLYYSKPKVAYVKTGQLFDEFVYKKELEKVFETTVGKRKFIIDSLEMKLKVMGASLTKENKALFMEYKQKEQEYMLRAEKFDEDNSFLREENIKKITKQLNQYVNEYGKQKGYDYILGAEGSGAIMFAKDENDITKDVLEFMNKKYKGDN